MIYETPEEAKLRLGSTVILHGRSALWVRNTDAQYGDEDNGEKITDIRLDTLLLPRLRSQKWVKMSDPKLNIKHLALGYINMQDEVSCYTLYLRRVPVRRYKQGLCRENVFIPESPKMMPVGLVPAQQHRGPRGRIPMEEDGGVEDEHENPKPLLRDRVTSFDRIMKTDRFKDMLNNTYPEYAEVIDTFRRLYENIPLKSMAFTKILSVEQDDSIGLVYIQYKGSKVAYSSDAGASFTLPRKHKHLAEVFEEHRLQLA